MEFQFERGKRTLNDIWKEWLLAFQDSYTYNKNNTQRVRKIAKVYAYTYFLLYHALRKNLIKGFVIDSRLNQPLKNYIENKGMIVSRFNQQFDMISLNRIDKKDVILDTSLNKYEDDYVIMNMYVDIPFSKGTETFPFYTQYISIANEDKQHEFNYIFSELEVDMLDLNINILMESVEHESYKNLIHKYIIYKQALEKRAPTVGLTNVQLELDSLVNLSLYDIKSDIPYHIDITDLDKYHYGIACSLLLLFCNKVFRKRYFDEYYKRLLQRIQLKPSQNQINFIRKFIPEFNESGYIIPVFSVYFQMIDTYDFQINNKWLHDVKKVFDGGYY